MTPKANPHIARALTFSPVMHKAVVEGRKTVTRRMANGDKPCKYRPGEVVACVTHWRTRRILDALRPSEIDPKAGFVWNTQPPDVLAVHFGGKENVGSFRQARFFPRSMYHRAPLRRIVSVTRERLQEITEEDAVREGIESGTVYTTGTFVSFGSAIVEVPQERFFYDETAREFETAREAYAALINTIHGPGTWAADPLVWRVEFEEVTPNAADGRKETV